jgi:hypothetical protein
MAGRSCLVLIACLGATALAGPVRSSDLFAGYEGVQLRAAPSKVKGFAAHWTAVIVVGKQDEIERNLKQYVHRGTPPAFLGVPVQKAMLQTSAHLHVVVGVALSIAHDHCDAMTKALDAAWGPAFDEGGPTHELVWKGDKVDASIEDDGPLACAVYIGDLNYDDEKDVFRKRD